MSPNLIFGPRKYAAYNLMIARWLANAGDPTQCYRYVTMGGTDLYDVVNLCWIRDGLVCDVVSYELDPVRFARAQKTGSAYEVKGIQARVVQGDIFGYRRGGEERHIFFIDLEGMFTLEHCAPISDWISYDVIRPGDLLLVTSYLGRKPGWQRTLGQFDAEFRWLRIGDAEAKKKVYDILHPLFIVHRALSRAGMEDEMHVRCLGYVRYTDSSPMGLYGFQWAEGSTQFAMAARDIATFDSNRRDWGRYN